MHRNWSLLHLTGQKSLFQITFWIFLSHASCSSRRRPSTGAKRASRTRKSSDKGPWERKSSGRTGNTDSLQQNPASSQSKPPNRIPNQTRLSPCTSCWHPRTSVDISVVQLELVSKQEPSRTPCANQPQPGTSAIAKLVNSS